MVDVNRRFGSSLSTTPIRRAFSELPEHQATLLRAALARRAAL
jgi:hypothetical protein